MYQRAMQKKKKKRTEEGKEITLDAQDVGEHGKGKDRRRYSKTKQVKAKRAARTAINLDGHP